MPRSALRVYWWNEVPNFGDSMNPLLISRLFGRIVEWAPLDQAELVGSGSVLQWITPVADQRTEPIHVWGSGFIFDAEPAPPPKSITVHAIRGKHSAQMLSDIDSRPLGDPGLLTSQVVRAPRAKRRRIGFVPHLWHQNHPTVRMAIERCDALPIDVRDEPESVIEKIAGCEYIFSSSLHGLVVADSLGIPNWWFTTDRKLFGGHYKFLDYYSAFGLRPEPIPLGKVSLTQIVETRAGSFQRGDVTALAERLLAAFPV